MWQGAAQATPRKAKMEIEMRSLTGFVRLAAAFVLASAVGAGPALAAGPVAGEGAAPATPPATAAKVDPVAWQSVITGQIEAFRAGDAPKALSYAGAAFKKTFTDPVQFMQTIAQSGYSPIFVSVSHNFGAFTQIDASDVAQVVNFVGPKQELYQAIYVLGLEPDGWRVDGVQLMKTDGMAV